MAGIKNRSFGGLAFFYIFNRDWLKIILVSVLTCLKSLHFFIRENYTQELPGKIFFPKRPMLQIKEVSNTGLTQISNFNHSPSRERARLASLVKRNSLNRLWRGGPQTNRPACGADGKDGPGQDSSIH